MAVCRPIFYFKRKSVEKTFVVVAICAGFGFLFACYGILLLWPCYCLPTGIFCKVVIAASHLFVVYFLSMPFVTGVLNAMILVEIVKRVSKTIL